MFFKWFFSCFNFFLILTTMKNIQVSRNSVIPYFLRKTLGNIHLTVLISRYAHVTCARVSFLQSCRRQACNFVKKEILAQVTFAYQGIRNVTLSENFAYVLNGWCLSTKLKQYIEEIICLINLEIDEGKMWNASFLNIEYET